MKYKGTTVQIIDALVEITRFRNRKLLEQCLVNTLVETFDSKEYRLYKVVVPPPEIVLSLVAHAKSKNVILKDSIHGHKISESLTEGIANSVDSGEVVTVKDNRRMLNDVIYPIFDEKDEIFAVLIQSTEEPYFEDQHLIDGMLKVYINYLMLLDVSQRDKLTGLLNRETLDDKISDILFKKSRQFRGETDLHIRRASDELPPWLAVIDIDYFKRVNDEFGHLIGDEILILFSRLMQDIFRAEDLLFRYGGEEFVVILNVFSKEDAICISERLRTKMEEYDFPRIGNITVSIGLVEMGKQKGNKDVIDYADAALYYAKANGRNRTCVYEDLLAAGELEDKNQSKSGDIELFGTHQVAGL